MAALSARSPMFLSANDCLTGDQKKVLFACIDKEHHEHLRELCYSTQHPSEDSRENYMEILHNLKSNALARHAKMKQKEKSTILKVLDCLKNRDGVGMTKTITRMEQVLSSAFGLPDDEESDVSFIFVQILFYVNL